jgi:PAS domain S-box-containing protein
MTEEGNGPVSTAGDAGGETNFRVTADGSASPGRAGLLSVLSRWSWIPLPLLCLAVLVSMVAPEGRPHEAPRLLLTLNYLFITVIPFLIAWLSALGYLHSPATDLLFLGCGALAFALAGLTATAYGILLSGNYHQYGNASVTIHNSLLWLSALLHLAGAAFPSRRHDPADPRLHVAAAYAATLAAGGALTIATLRGTTPLFFVDGAGGTPFRHVLLGSAMVLFGVAGILLSARRDGAKGTFHGWYGEGLLLLSAGVLALLLQKSLGSAVCWVGRTAQYLSGLYMAVAALVSLRGGKARGATLASALTDAHRRLEDLFDLSADGIAVHEIPRGEKGAVLVQSNRALAGIFGYGPGEERLFDGAGILGEEEVRALRSGNGEEAILRHEKVLPGRSGAPLSLEISTRRFTEGGRIRAISTVRDVTFRKRLETERESTLDFLRFVNECGHVEELVSGAVPYFRRWSGCEAVAIRVREGDAVPCLAADGFPEGSAAGKGSSDGEGEGARPSGGGAEGSLPPCVCERVLRGTVGEAGEWFTAGGSFRTGSAAETASKAPSLFCRPGGESPCLREGDESIALLPMRVGDERLGLVQLSDRKRGVFDGADFYLLEKRAGYLALAFARHRAEERVRRGYRKSNLLAETAGELLRTREPKTVVDAVCGKAMEELQCQVFFNYLADFESGGLRLNAFAGIPEEKAREISRLDYGVAVCGCVARDRERIVACDIAASDDERVALVRGLGIRAYACHPLLGPEGLFLGTLSFGTRTRDSFTEEELSLMEGVADLVTIAMIRTRGEDAVASTLHRLDAHIENSPLAVIEFDLAHRVTRWSRECERLFGWSAQEVVGKAMWEIAWILPEEAEHIRGVERSLLDGTTSRSRSVNRNFRKDGSVAYCEWYNSAIYDGAGRLVSILSQVLDVTNRTRAETELARYREQLEERVRERTNELTLLKEGLEREMEARRAAEEEMLKARKLEAVGVLAAGIAHDFNNSLTAILNAIRASRMAIPSRHEAAETLRIAEDAARGAGSLTRQLLSFSRGGAPVKKAVSLEALLRETAEFAVRGSKGACTFFFPPDLWPADADEGQICQVVTNVVLNADQAMPRGGTIAIRAENEVVDCRGPGPLAPGRYVRIDVTDQGGGIPPEILPRIFDPYFTTRLEGTGLGLYSSYAIVSKHGGHIAAESRPGEGSTFRIHLPAATGEALPKAHLQPLAVGGGGERVLLLEDDPLVAEAVRRGLSVFGMAADRAAEGGEAIRMYRAAAGCGSPYDVVVLDLTVPGGMGGEETIRHLLEGDGKVRAIVASGYAEEHVMSDYREHGFRGVIPKPYDLDALVGEIRRVLREG